MKQGGFGLFTILLVSIVMVPVGVSKAQTTNDTTVTNESVGVQDQIAINKTSSNLSSNQTMVQANAFATQVSDFVHQAVADFQKQRNETINAIHECYSSLQNAAPEDREKVRTDCRSTLDGIKQKYQDERKQFSDLFKEFRDSIITLRMNAEGLHVDKGDVDKAIGKIKEMKENMLNATAGAVGMGNNVEKGLRTRGNSNCVNPPNGPMIC